MEKSWQGHYVKLSVVLMGTIGICAFTFPVKRSKHWVVGDVGRGEVIRCLLALDRQANLTAAGAAHRHLYVLLLQQLSRQGHDLLLGCRLQVCGTPRCNEGGCQSQQGDAEWQYRTMIGHNTGGCWITIQDNDWSQHGRMLSHNTWQWMVTTQEDVESQYRTMPGHNMGGCWVTIQNNEWSQYGRMLSHNNGQWLVTIWEDVESQ